MQKWQRTVITLARQVSTGGICFIWIGVAFLRAMPGRYLYGVDGIGTLLFLDRSGIQRTTCTQLAQLMVELVHDAFKSGVV